MLKNAVAAVVYVSESKPSVISDLRAAAMKACSATPGSHQSSCAQLVNTFRDETYNRSSFVLAGSPLPVAHAAYVLTSEALRSLPDLRMHSATHPRIGIVDHISIAPLVAVAQNAESVQTCPVGTPLSPLGGSSLQGTEASSGDRGLESLGKDANMSDAVIAANALSRALAGDPVDDVRTVFVSPESSPVGSPDQNGGGGGDNGGGGGGGDERAQSGDGPRATNGDVDKDSSVVDASSTSAQSLRGLGVSVMLYGAAHPVGRGLAETRRQTPYFGKVGLGGRGGSATPAPKTAAGEEGLTTTPAAAAAAAAGRGGEVGVGESGLSSASCAALPPPPSPADAPFASSDHTGDPSDPWGGVTPDLGPQRVNPAVGVCCVGACRLVLNYNVRLRTKQRRVAVAAAKAVRTRRKPLPPPPPPSHPVTPEASHMPEPIPSDNNSSSKSSQSSSSGGGNGDGGSSGGSGGGGLGSDVSEGLPFVEALALEHQGDLYEVACNLLEPSVTTPEMVLARISAVASALGVEVDEAYTIGLTEAQILEKLDAAALAVV